MGRGSHYIALGVLLFFGATLLAQFLSCFHVNAPQYNVPRCSSVSTCMKVSGVPDEARVYGDQVAHAWYYVNKVYPVFDAINDVCRGDYNLSELSLAVGSVISNSGKDVGPAIHYSTRSVEVLENLLASYTRQLSDSGLEFTPYSDLHEIYNEMSDALLASNGKRDASTSLGKALYRYNKNVKRIFSELGVEYGLHILQIARPISNTVHIFVPAIPASVFESVIITASGVNLPRISGENLVNLSVGVSDSVYSAAIPVLRTYYDVVERYNEKAKSIYEDAMKLRDEVEDRATELRSIGIDEFTPEILAMLPVSKAVQSVVSESPQKISDSAIVVSESLLRAIEGNLSSYSARDLNYYLHLYYAEQNLKQLEKLSIDLETQISTYRSLVKGCYSFVSKYSPRSGYVKTELPKYVAALRSDPDVGLCAAALRLVSLDNKYSSDEAILSSCEAKVSCGAKALPEDYPCVGGTISDRVSCCLRYRDRLAHRIASSPEYAHYLKMRSAVLRLLSYVQDPAVESKFLDLPSGGFICERDLSDALNRVTRIYLELRKVASQRVHPSFTVLDPVDTKTATSVRIHFSVDAGGADIITRINLPFQILAYRTEDSNGLWFELAPGGKTLYIRGSGSATVLAEVMPVSLETKVLGSAYGLRYIQLRNPFPFPVRHPIAGMLESATPNVSYDGKVLTFHGVGEAVVAVRAVDMNYVVDGGEAYVSLRNTSEYGYDGDIVLPLSARDLPKGCRSAAGSTICHVSINPYSEESLVLKGVSSEYNLLSIPQSVEKQDVFVSFTPTAQLDERDSHASDRLQGLRGKIAELVSELNSWYLRAVDLNISDMLPYSGGDLADVAAQADDTNDSLVLSSIATSLEQTRRSVVSTVKAYLHGLPEDSELRDLSEKAFTKGDYMLALALAASYRSHAQRRSFSVPVAATVLALLSLGVLVYYLRTQNPKRKKRIPKI